MDILAQALLLQHADPNQQIIVVMVNPIPDKHVMITIKFQVMDAPAPAKLKMDIFVLLRKSIHLLNAALGHQGLAWSVPHS